MRTPGSRSRLPTARVPESLRRRSGMVALAVTGVLWGSIGVAVRFLQDGGLSTVSIGFWRVVCACVVLVPLLGPRGARALWAQRHRPGRLLVVGAGSLGFQLTYFVAVRDVGVGVATLVTLGLAPVTVTVIEAVRGRRAPCGRTVAVLVCALAGLALVTTASGVDVVTAPRPVAGLLEAAVSGLLYGGTTVIGAPLSTRVGPLVITAASSLLAVVLLLPVALATGVAVPVTPAVVGGLVHLGVVTTVIAYGLFYAGLRTTPGSVAMVLTLLEPATAVVLAAVLLGEPLPTAAVAGAVLLLTAVAVLYAGGPADPAARASPPPP